MRLSLPQPVKTVLRALDRAGFEAYLVGGCVRDALLGRPVGDYDLTTSATPEEMLEVFRDFKVLKTGLKHGTLTVLLEGLPMEVTTYRVESGYSDHRRPDRVSYTGDLSQDLCRRDFTVNALAYRPESGVVDLFGGVEDLRRRRLKCIGEPHERFSEDGLRILRALRFASVLEFTLEERTAQALHRDVALLQPIARERCWQELSKLLTGPAAAAVLAEYPEVFLAVVPQADLTAARLRELPQLPPDPVLRLGALVLNAPLPEGWNPLRLDRAAARRIAALNRLSQEPLPRDRAGLLRLLRREGPEAARDLCALRGDDTCRALLADLEIGDGCWKVGQLRISGEDLKDMGVSPGPRMGEILEKLLDRVMDGSCPNEKAALLQAAGELKSEE